MKGITQNQNEAFNSILWSKCQKRVFCGRHKPTIGVFIAVIQWNTGAAGLGRILTSLGVNKAGVNTNVGFGRKNLQSIKSLALKCKSSVRKRRQQLCQMRKRKPDLKPSYVSGGFSIHAEPDEIVSKKLKLDNDEELDVIFIDETKLDTNCLKIITVKDKIDFNVI